MRIAKNSILVIALLACYLTGAGQRNALTATEAETFRTRVLATIRTLKSLESDFVQTKQLGYLEKPVQASGKLYFKAPDRIRWEYLAPKASVELYDLASAKKSRSTAGLLATALNGDVFDETRFEATYQQAREGYAVVLTPKEKALGKYVKHIELTFDGDTYLIRRITITEPSADFTQLDFERQRKDQAIPDDKFIK